MQKLYRTVKLDGVKAKSAGEYFGTLQESITALWREHLKTTKYSDHMALDEYYTDMPDKVDSFIEAYIAVSGSKIMNYSCNFKAKNLTPLEYLKLLKAFLEDGREEYCGEHSELNSCLDDCLELIDSTIYKLRELHEALQEESGLKDLRDFIAESLQNVNEASKTKPFNVDQKLFVEFLKVISAGSAGNYSQLGGLDEYFVEQFDDFDEAWGDALDEIICSADGDWQAIRQWLGDQEVKGYKDRILVFEEFIRILVEDYSSNTRGYMDDAERIEDLKKDKKPEDFGVEKEDYYTLYEFDGPAKDKKLAKLIASYGDCTEDYSGYDR